jgi:EpsI family protein
MTQVSSLKRRAPTILSVFLIVQGSLFYGFSRGETAPFSRPLDGFPKEIGGWRMIQQGVMEQEVKDVLRADDYITRGYAASPEQFANLFVAFFKSQRAGQRPHSPKNCLPGSGWVWTIADTIPVTIAGRAAPIEVNRYLVSKGENRSLVLYWYQSRDRVVASEYKAAALVAWDALRYNRTDTALVRVVVPVAQGRDDVATKIGVEFIQAFFGALRKFFPV